MLGMAFLALALASPLLMSRRSRLFLAIPVSVFQLYIPGAEIGKFPLSIAFLGGLALWPEFIKGIKITLRWLPTSVLLGLILLFGISLLWSVDIRMGLREIANILIFLMIFTASVLEARRNSRHIVFLLKILVFFGLSEAFLIFLQRLEPVLKMEFLKSSIAQIFVNLNTLNGLFGNFANNILSPDKSGGFIVNANVAGAYMGILAILAFGLFLHVKQKWLIGASFILYVSVFFTGSKAGILLGILIPLSVIYIVLLRLKKSHTIFWGGIVVVISPLVMVVWKAGYLLGVANEFGKHADSTLGIREKIWGYAGEAFLHHPIMGQGFGGWQQGFPYYAQSFGLEASFPPHNTLVYLWSQGGIFASILGLAFIIMVLQIGWKITTKWDKEFLGISISFLGMFLWLFIEGMGTNYGLLGDIHMMPVMATMLAIIYTLIRSGQIHMDTSCA